MYITSRGYVDRSSIQHLVTSQHRRDSRPYLNANVQERLLAPALTVDGEAVRGATDPGESNLPPVLWQRVLEFASHMQARAREARSMERELEEVSLDPPPGE